MSARPQVTITLGRTGQVVKRARPSDDADHFDDTGGKRPVRERLGSNVEDSNSYGSQYKKKRQRMESGSSFRNDNLNDDKHISSRHISRDDLRLKLMKKIGRKNFTADKANGVDLREKLSRNTQRLLRYDSRQAVPESRTTGDLRRIPPTRSADDLLQLDSLRKSYSPWPLDGLRKRHRSPELRRGSPDRLASASRVLASPRNYDELRHVPSFRSIDASRPSSFMKEGVIDASRPEPYVSKAAAPVNAIKPVVRPPIGGVVQKTSFTSEEPLTVSSLLHSLGLTKYAIHFQAEEVDMTALRQMGDHDLKELGIPMGPRKKILLAVSKRHR